METCLPEKPEVLAISAKTGLHPDNVVGKCFRLWRWFDSHTQEGNAVGVTLVTLGYALGNGDDTSNFINAMVDVGWLSHDANGVTLPNFDRHNGQTAKSRALTAKRVAKHKEKTNAPGNAIGNGVSVSAALPREEKRREDKKTYDAQAHLVSLGVDKKIASDWLKTRKVKKLAPTETAIESVMNEAKATGKSLNDVIKICCEQGWGGFKAQWLENLPADYVSVGSKAEQIAEAERKEAERRAAAKPSAPSPFEQWKERNGVAA